MSSQSESDEGGDSPRNPADENAESSALDSLSEEDVNESQNVVTQRDVFGSDTESDEPSSPKSAIQKSKNARTQDDNESENGQSQGSADEDHDDDDSPVGRKHTDRDPSPVAAKISHNPLDSGSDLSDGEGDRGVLKQQEHSDDSDTDDDGPVEAAVSKRRIQRSTSSASSAEPSDSGAEREANSPEQSGPSRLRRTNLDDGSHDDDEGEEEQEDEENRDEGDETGDHEPDETRIAVDFPLIRADLGREMHLVKMPNFLSVETRPFDPNFYEDELDEDEVLDEEGRTRLKLKVENTIRWRYGKTPEGELVHESNARIVRWSDGSLSLHLGDEIFDIHKVDIHSDYNYLFIREGSGLQGQSSLRTKLTFRPHSTDSFTHRKITLSLADKTNKSQKVKILPVAGADPETNRNALVRKEEEKLRATLRRESQLRRMRERQAITRSSFGGGERRRGYTETADDEEEDEDDGNTTSLNALKRNAKAALNTNRKEVSAIYSSSESESLSDISEPKARKKLRAKISDEEDSD